MSYAATVQRWHDFFLVEGGASATLVGLLFVGLSLHLRAVVTRADVRGLARVTMTNFALGLLASLFIVIPQSRSGASSQLIVSGAVSLAIVAPSLVSAARTREWTLNARSLIMRFGLSVLCYVGVAVAGIELAAGSVDSAFVWLAGSVVAVLTTSLRNTWDLLVTVGAATLGGEHSEHAPKGS